MQKKAIVPYLKEGNIVILESISRVGATDKKGTQFDYYSMDSFVKATNYFYDKEKANR